MYFRPVVADSSVIYGHINLLYSLYSIYSQQNNKYLQKKTHIVPLGYMGLYDLLTRTANSYLFDFHGNRIFLSPPCKTGGDIGFITLPSPPPTGILSPPARLPHGSPILYTKTIFFYVVNKSLHLKND